MRPVSFLVLRDRTVQIPVSGTKWRHLASTTLPTHALQRRGRSCDAHHADQHRQRSGIDRAIKVQTAPASKSQFSERPMPAPPADLPEKQRPDIRRSEILSFEVMTPSVSLLPFNLMTLRNLRHSRPATPNRHDSLKLVVVMPNRQAVPMARLPTKAVQHDPDLLFPRIMFASRLFDFVDDLLARIFPCSSCLSHLSLLRGHDEPRTLSYQIPLFGPIGADVRHSGESAFCLRG